MYYTPPPISIRMQDHWYRPAFTSQAANFENSMDYDQLASEAS